MANRVHGPPPATGTQYHTFDTTDLTPEAGEPGHFGSATGSTIGSFMIQIEGSGFTGEITPYLQAPGATSVSMGWIAAAYQDLNTGDDVTGGTAITGNGLYAVRADHGLLLRLAVTVSAGSLKILVTEGVG